MMDVFLMNNIYTYKMFVIHLTLISLKIFNQDLKKDVLLLAYAFEEFISTSLRYYVLDPSHYFRAPGLSWGAMLKMTKIE